MKQFSLEEYLKNPSRQVVTRYGKRVRIICADFKNGINKPIIGFIKEIDNEDHVYCFTEKGRYNLPENEKSFKDLFFATEKKEYFDPKTLQPFDRVLVRNFKAYKWKCEHFSYFKENDDYPCMCCSNSYAFCIPYNDDTKHLIDTSNEVPEYYRYWEE